MALAFDYAVQKGAKILVRDLPGNRYQYVAKIGEDLYPGEVHSSDRTLERFFVNNDLSAAQAPEIKPDTVLRDVNPDTSSGELIPFANIAATSIDVEERTMVATLTTAEVDRGGTFVVTKGINLSDYRKNPIVLWSHMSWMFPLGTNMWIKTEGEKAMIGKTRFAQRPAAHSGEWLPDTVFDLYRQQVLRAISIGVRSDKSLFSMDSAEETQKAFKEHKEWKGAWRVVAESLMLEYSCCSIPMNGNALSRAYEAGFSIPAPVMQVLGIPNQDQAKALATVEQTASSAPVSSPSPGTPLASSAPCNQPVVLMTADDVFCAARALGANNEIAKVIVQCMDLNKAVKDGIDKARGRV